MAGRENNQTDMDLKGRKGYKEIEKGKTISHIMG